MEFKLWTKRGRLLEDAAASAQKKIRLGPWSFVQSPFCPAIDHFPRSVIASPGIILKFVVLCQQNIKKFHIWFAFQAAQPLKYAIPPLFDFWCGFNEHSIVLELVFQFTSIIIRLLVCGFQDAVFGLCPRWFPFFRLWQILDWFGGLYGIYGWNDGISRHNHHWVIILWGILVGFC